LKFFTKIGSFSVRDIFCARNGTIIGQTWLIIAAILATVQPGNTFVACGSKWEFSSWRIGKISTAFPAFHRIYQKRFSRPCPCPFTFQNFYNQLTVYLLIFFFLGLGSVRVSYSSCLRHHMPFSLRPLGARSSHWYMPQRMSNPRA